MVVEVVLDGLYVLEDLLDGVLGVGEGLVGGGGLDGYVLELGVDGCPGVLAVGAGGGVVGVVFGCVLAFGAGFVHHVGSSLFFLYESVCVCGVFHDVFFVAEFVDGDLEVEWVDVS